MSGGETAPRSLFEHLALDLFDQEGQVGAGKAQIRSWNAVVLNVGRHVLVMGMRAGQGEVVRMRGGIIPIES
ncbi:MAG: hypothetical protein QXZ09_04015 [Candidatus Methanomethylicaceae archaeon]